MNNAIQTRQPHNVLSRITTYKFKIKSVLNFFKHLDNDTIYCPK